MRSGGGGLVPKRVGASRQLAAGLRGASITKGPAPALKFAGRGGTTNSCEQVPIFRLLLVVEVCRCVSEISRVFRMQILEACIAATRRMVSDIPAPLS
jgi:hypothetical protein